MKYRSPLTAIAIAALAMNTFPANADAQLGGLIKKKVKEAITKPTEKVTQPQPQTEAAAPASSPAAAAPSNSRDPFAAQRVPNNRALLITDAMLTRIARGLDAEHALIKDYEKQLTKFPTKEQFDACRLKAAQTPEGQRLMNPGNFLKEGMKPDELQNAMMKMTTESDAYYKKACPVKPVTDYEKSERMRQIRTKAASLATAASAPAAAAPSHLLFEVNPFDFALRADSDTVLILGTGGLDENDFGEMIERILKYCELKKTMDVKPKSGGLKVPGEGRDIYWVYTESELVALQKFDCAAFRKKYNDLLGAYGA
jgi:hypothetical protein